MATRLPTWPMLFKRNVLLTASLEEMPRARRLSRRMLKRMLKKGKRLSRKVKERLTLRKSELIYSRQMILI